MPSVRIPRYFYPIMGAYATVVAAAFHFEFPWVALLPLLLGVAWLAFHRLDILMLMLVACVPLSISLEDLEIGGIGAYLPTEPLLAGVLLLFLTLHLKDQKNKNLFHPQHILNHKMLVF